MHARSVPAAAIRWRHGRVVPDQADPVLRARRVLTAAGIRCEVVAPSKLQKPAGDRVKTDARDAVHLARLLRLDEITAVAIPTVGQESARDLVRAREDCRGDLMTARHRLSKLLLRHGIVYYGGKAWTGKHDQGLHTQARPQLTTRATRMTFDASYESVLVTKARRDRLDAEIEEMAADSEFTPLVRRLGCLRGIGTLTGFALAVEAAWHHRPRYTIGATMQARWDLAPAAARIRGDEGNRRLHQRWVRFIDRRKRSTTADVAIARELAGWCWSLAVMQD